MEQTMLVVMDFAGKQKHTPTVRIAAHLSRYIG